MMTQVRFKDCATDEDICSDIIEHTEQQVQWNHLFDCIKDASLSGFLTIQFSGTGFTTAAN